MEGWVLLNMLLEEDTYGVAPYACMLSCSFLINNNHSFLSMLFVSLLWNAINDIEKVGRQGGSSNQSTVNVWLLEQILGIGPLHGSTVLNTNLLGNRIRNIFTNPFADLCMCFLGHFRSGRQTSSDAKFFYDDDYAMMMSILR
jgi:hypothetical protein